MARNRKKKALYEVISRTPGYDRTVEKLHPEEHDTLEPGEAGPEAMPERPTQWPRRPRLVQVNAGRIEFSMPYQLAIALLLAVVLLLLVVFRLGRISGGPRPADAGTIRQGPGSKEQPGSGTDATAPLPGLGSQMTDVTAPGEGLEVPKQMGNNVIVLQEFDRHADLVPVKNHFDDFGITTEIVRIGGRYFLQTVDRYDNPAKPGTDGYKALQNIKAVGALYKAPGNYETFSKHRFSDAYGKKVK